MLIDFSYLRGYLPEPNTHKLTHPASSCEKIESENKCSDELLVTVFLDVILTYKQQYIINRGIQTIFMCGI